MTNRIVRLATLAIAIVLAVVAPRPVVAQVRAPVGAVQPRVADVSQGFRDVERYNALLRQANAAHASAFSMRAKHRRNALVALAFVGAGAWATSQGAFSGNLETTRDNVVALTGAIGLGAGIPLVFLNYVSKDDWKIPHRQELDALDEAHRLFPDRNPRGR